MCWDIPCMVALNHSQGLECLSLRLQLQRQCDLAIIAVVAGSKSLITLWGLIWCEFRLGFDAEQWKGKNKITIDNLLKWAGPFLQTQSAVQGMNGPSRGPRLEGGAWLPGGVGWELDRKKLRLAFFEDSSSTSSTHLSGVGGKRLRALHWSDLDNVIGPQTSFALCLSVSCSPTQSPCRYQSERLSGHPS